MELKVLVLRDISYGCLSCHKISLVKFGVYLGRESHLPEFVGDRRVDGLVPGSANVDPELFKRLYEPRNAEECLPEAQALNAELKAHPNGYIAGIKQALVERRIIETADMFNQD